MRMLLPLTVAACSAAPSDMPESWDAVPSATYCDSVRDWDLGWTEHEEAVLAEVNARRNAGASCGTAGNFKPSPPLAMDPALRCAARLHSADMDERNFFDHTNPSGESPFLRMENAGYIQSTAGENIAGGDPDPAGTVAQWMASDPHCSNIMNPGFEHTGVGYHPGGEYGHLWTQVFASP